jgi:hypothetical protein
VLARTINDDGYAMLDADTDEVRETWPDGTPAARDLTLRLTGWYGSAGDPAAYWMEEFEEEGRFGEEISWRLSWLDPRTLRPSGSPLFEMSGGAPDPVAAAGDYLLGELNGTIMVLSGIAPVSGDAAAGRGRDARPGGVP